MPLDQEHAADAIFRGVEVAAVDEEVGEEDDVAPLGHDRSGAGEGEPPLVDVVVPGLRGRVLQGAVLAEDSHVTSTERGLHERVDLLRSHVQMTSAKFSRFFTPSPCQNL